MRIYEQRLLRRQNLLREADGIHRTQRWSSRRQTRRAQRKVRVKAVVTRAGRIVNAGALVSSHRLTIVIEAHHRSAIVANHAPVFQEAQEVMHTAVGSKVLRLAGNGRKWNSFAGNNRSAVRRRHRSSVVYVVWKGERVDVVPVVGKERHSIPFHRRGDADSAPGSVVYRSVVVALNVNGIFRGNRQSVGSAAGGSNDQ